MRAGRVLLSILLFAALLYCGIVTLLYVGQRKLLFQPNTSRPHLAQAEVPGLRQVEITATDGLKLLAWFKPAQHGKPTLLYLHGNGGNLDNRIPRVRRAAETGWGLLFLEYRGYGGNPGSPSEDGFVADISGALGYLRGQEVGPERIVLYGESLGTGLAVRLASGQNFAAMVLESPYTSIAAIAQAMYWFIPVDLLIRDRFALLSRIGQVHTPLLVLQGGQDRIVPPRMSSQVFAAANQPKQLWTAPQAGHEDLMRFGAFDAVTAFVEGAIRHTQPRAGTGAVPWN